MKTACMITLIFISFFSVAQEKKSFGFEKGNIILSGSVNYYQDKGDSFKEWDFIANSQSTSLSLVPEIGYFLTDHFVMGAKASYNNSTSKSSQESIESLNFFNRYERNASGYGTSLYGRYYFSPKKRISVYTEIEAGYSKTNEVSENWYEPDAISSSNEGTRKQYTVGITPGINIFLTQNFSLTSKIGHIGYTKSKYDGVSSRFENETYTSENENFNANIGLDNFFFGILYRI